MTPLSSKKWVFNRVLTEDSSVSSICARQLPTTCNWSSRGSNAFRPHEHLISHAHVHIDTHTYTCVLGKKKSLKWLLKLLSLHFPHIYSTFGILKQYTIHDFSYCYLGGKYERRQKLKKKKDKDFSIHEIYSQIPNLLQTVCALVCALVDACYPF